ncbi:MAG TPA: hypothetical protein VGL38_06000 [bacterium]|jgi:hypothetical protein
MGRFADAAREAAQATDEKFATRIANLTRLRDEDIQRFFPEPADRQHLLELLDLVDSATEENEKVSRIMENAETLGVAAVRLLKLLA